MIVGDSPASKPSPRLYKREWKPSYWRGSLDEIVGAARAALDEFKRQHPEDEVFEVVNLDFTDESQQDLGSLDGLENALPTIEIGEVSGLWIGVSTGLAEFAVRIVAGPRGLYANAEGTEAFATGMVAILKSRLAGGAEAGEQSANVPLRFIDYVVCGVAVILPITVSVYLETRIAGTLVPLISFLGLLVPMLAFVVTIIGHAQQKGKPAPFVVVAEGEQFSDGSAERTGPVWQAKAWFEEHPLVAVVTLLIVGALLGRAAELIKL